MTRDELVAALRDQHADDTPRLTVAQLVAELGEDDTMPCGCAEGMHYCASGDEGVPL